MCDTKNLHFPGFFLFAKTACRTAGKSFEFSLTENTLSWRKRRKFSRKHYKFHTKNIRKTRPVALALFTAVSSAKRALLFLAIQCIHLSEFWKMSGFTPRKLSKQLVAPLTESNILLKNYHFSCQLCLDIHLKLRNFLLIILKLIG